MKALSFFFLFLFSLQECEAQKAVVGNDYANIAYLIVPNPLHFAVEGFECSEFVISTDNGKIKMFEDSCSFYFYPSKVGSAVITIKGKKNKYVKNLQYYVRAYPLPKAHIGGMEDGSIKKSRLLVNEGIVARINDFGYDARAPIQDYTINIIRNDTTLLVSKIIGSQFGEKLNNFFGQLKKGDQLIFSKISCKIDSNFYQIEPLFLIITE